MSSSNSSPGPRAQFSAWEPPGLCPGWGKQLLLSFLLCMYPTYIQTGNTKTHSTGTPHLWVPPRTSTDTPPAWHPIPDRRAPTLQVMQIFIHQWMHMHTPGTSSFWKVPTFSPSGGIRHMGWDPQSCSSCQRWAFHSLHSLSTSSSWFWEHTLFPPGWLEVKDPTGSRSLCWDPTGSSNWHHRPCAPTPHPILLGECWEK